MKLDNKSRCMIKNEAKACIFEQLMPCVAAMLVYALPAAAIGTLTAVTLGDDLTQMLQMLAINLACEVIIMGPIMLGVQQFFVGVARHEQQSLWTLFAPLGEIRGLFRGIRMTLCLMVRMILLSLIPTALYEAVSYVAMQQMVQNGAQTLEEMIPVISVLFVMFLILLLPAIGLVASCWMGYAVLKDDPACGVWKATRIGCRMMKGQRKQMIAFVLSFVPWIIGGFFTCGLLSVFGVMYFCTALYRLYDKMRGEEIGVGAK